MKSFYPSLLTMAVVVLGAKLHGANIPPLFNAAGSSAMFNSFALAARSSGGTHNYTIKGKAFVNDTRLSSIPQEGGNFWVVWNDTPAPNTRVLCYISVDSTIGVRAWFAVPRATLSVDSSVQSTAGQNLVPGLPPDESSLPAAIWSVINGAAFNAAMTDIRPEDAKFATTRALAALTSNRSGLGYGPGPVGTAIKSAVSTKQFTPVDFNVTGTDPITNGAVPHYSTSSVGAAPVVVFVNTTDTAPGGLGSLAITNINRFVLTGYLNGSLTRTRDLAQSTAPSVPVTALLREPLSGTYNTMEFCIPRSSESGSSQEIGVNPAVDNPLNQTAPDGGKRMRVIGTSEMVSTVSSTADSLGYAFWSFSNFAPALTTAKYLAVDGVDPLQASYVDGAFPTTANTGVVTFTNIKNGTYPIWSVLRVVTDAPVPTAVRNLISAAQATTATTPDFVPAPNLNVFRSHYAQSGVNPHNGHLTGAAELGGDMGGAVYTVSADLDFIADTGKELVNKKQ
jgi:ABC-type phosphate transport system substrate-binding protein